MRHPSSFEHDTGGHPENARRLTAIEEAMSERDWLGMELVEAPAATREQLLRVHTAAHVDSIEELAESGGGPIDLDTVASAGSWEAALHAAGARCARSRAAAGRGRLGLLRVAATRPPRRAGPRDGLLPLQQRGGRRPRTRSRSSESSASWCSTGTSTTATGPRRSSTARRQVLYSSIHQSPLYPGTGAATDFGSGDGEGFTVNLPVPPGSGPDEFLSLVQNVVAPIAREWRPGLLCISAGYDAHRDDPARQLRGGRRRPTRTWRRRCATLRAELDVPVLVCLEGGYSLGALARSVVATLEAFGGDREPRMAPAEPADEYRQRLARFWPALGGSS